MARSAEAVRGSAAETPVAPDRAVLELEAVAARSWPASETAEVDGWLLRAAGGWTGRANSCLPLGAVPADLDGRLALVRRWYARRGLPARVAVPLPARRGLAGALLARGWRAEPETLVRTAALTEVHRRAAPARGWPPPRWTATPPPGWLALYRSTDGPLPPVALAVLGGGAGFASVETGGRTVAVARCAVEGPWAGLAAFEVEASRRRRGLATHLLHHVAAWALGRGATTAWLQVGRDNAAAVTLYGRVGFATHHTYRYYVAPEEGDR